MRTLILQRDTDVASVEAIHGHGGATRIEWTS